MLAMTEPRLAEITDRVNAWREVDDRSAFTLGDAAELLREVSYLRRQREHDVHLLRRCRDELIRVNDQYQELMARADAWAEQEREEPDLSALLVQDQAEEGPQ